MSPAPRVPFGSDLARCVHRLARLQTTVEMREDPTTVSKQDLALDRLILAARRVLRDS